MEVISLTKDKVNRVMYNEKSAISKKTTISEFYNLKIARNFLQKKRVKLFGCEYDVNVPELYLWENENNCIIMEECIGKNIELMLRNMKERKEGLETLHTMMKFILDEKFYWHDFAPRNILLNKNKNAIYIIDFERGLTIGENINLKDFLRENVYEEYVAFLLPEERSISEEKVVKPSKEEMNILINVNNIKSNRVKRIAQKLGLPQNIYYSQYLNIISMIISAEKPFRKDGSIKFPIIELEQKLIDDGYEAYLDEILIRNKIFEKER